MIWKILFLVCLLLSGVLLVKLFGMRRSLREIVGSLQEKLHEETNTPITVSSSDSAVRALAAALNEQLRILRKEQLRLQSGNHELQNAITNVAHDLRTPLTAISGYMELLERDLSDEKAPYYLTVIRERTEALKVLTEDLFRYSIIDHTADTFHAENLSLNDELEIALAAAYQVLVSRGITPKIQIPAQSVKRNLDRKALQRIFGNILNNAAKYSAGDLCVQLDQTGTISFSNLAPGLTEIDVGKLFDRFYTVENAKGSTGLGLSIARRLTEMMGGRIRAEYQNQRLKISLTFGEAQ